MSRIILTRNDKIVGVAIIAVMLVWAGLIIAMAVNGQYLSASACLLLTPVIYFVWGLFIGAAVRTDEDMWDKWL